MKVGSRHQAFGSVAHSPQQYRASLLDEHETFWIRLAQFELVFPMELGLGPLDVAELPLLKERLVEWWQVVPILHARDPLHKVQQDRALEAATQLIRMFQHKCDVVD